MKYKEVYIVASLSLGGGRGYYEVVPVTFNGDRVSSKKLFFHDCRAKGLIKRHNHTKKLIEFLNSEEGNKWFDENSRDFAW